MLTVVDGVDHVTYMRLALDEAQTAYALGEVPIGAVVINKGIVIARAHNMKETWQDPTAHAEMIAMRRASQYLGRWRLTGTVLYVTVEPCPMCAGALVQSRIDTLVYGAKDPKAGAVDSLFNIVRNEQLNHQLEVISGVLAEECAALMQAFFRSKRG